MKRFLWFLVAAFLVGPYARAGSPWGWSGPVERTGAPVAADRTGALASFAPASGRPGGSSLPAGGHGPCSQAPVSLVRLHQRYRSALWIAFFESRPLARPRPSPRGGPDRALRSLSNDIFHPPA